jgi:short-subunit dehydrogenase
MTTVFRRLLFARAAKILPQRILITGASSGIGAALAEAYAAPGIHLFLSGRDGERLAAVVACCQSKGAFAEGRCLDVRDAAAMADWIAACEAQGPLDLVVANAGISSGVGGENNHALQTRLIMGVNVDGVMNTVLPALDAMRPRRRGHVALVASVAGFRGLPSAPAYCASKAAVKVWGEGLRGWLARENIYVSVILPGFVESRITAANDFSMPLLMSAPKAARIIQNGLARNRGRIAFPWPTVFVSWLAAALPDWMMDWIGRRLPEKRATTES